MKVLRFVILFALMNTFADPLIYAFRSDDFRKYFIEIIHSVVTRITSFKSSAKSFSLNKCEEFVKA